ncbi:MAG: hypothetical protein GEU99_22985 [Luteitalea sp.]|nr:hypothetical protein [Luteitalea sp.]
MRRTLWLSFLGIATLVVSACQGDFRPYATDATSMNPIAESYVKLVLAVGQHDPDYVDAYYGPPEWKTASERQKISLGDIRSQADSLIAQLRSAVPAAEDDEMVRLRHQYLRRQLEALVSRVRMLSGETLSFDEEAKALYDAVPPSHTEAEFQKVLARLEGELPGSGDLIDRYEAYKEDFVIPSDRLDAVFQAAIDACRERTVEHLTLPAEEKFRVEYVTDKSWSGYNWYQGGFRSVIQINTDLPIYIDRAIDLACHEGYPGHHVYNVLLERELVRDRGWVEASIYALFSPQSLIAEGTANFGIEIAFPGEERVAYEKDALFPLAGLAPDEAERYYRIVRLTEELSYAGNEAARRYLNGQIDRPQAADWLVRYAMMPRPRAEQRVQFIDQYRSYVINYNLGKDMVRDYVTAQGGTKDQLERRWEVFGRLLASPRLPSSLN